MSMILRWEYRNKGEAWIDGPWGRYYVGRRAKGSRDFTARLNGKGTVYYGDTLDQAVSAISRVIKANWPEYS